MRIFFRLIPYWNDMTDAAKVWRKNNDHDLNVAYDTSWGRCGLIMWHPYSNGRGLSFSQLTRLRLSDPNYRINGSSLPSGLVIEGNDGSWPPVSGNLGKYDIFVCPENGWWNLSGIIKIATRENSSKNRIDSLSVYLGLLADSSTDELPGGYPPIYDGSAATSTTEADGRTYTWYDFQNHARGGNYPANYNDFEWMHHVEKTFYLKRGQALRFAYYSGAKCSIISDADRSLFCIKTLPDPIQLPPTVGQLPG